jgi:hypothetical protein
MNGNSSSRSNKGSRSTTSTTNHSRSSSPPPPSSQKRSPSDPSTTSYTSSSSDGVPDEVFAMFIEDEYKRDSEDEDENIQHVKDESAFFDTDSDDDNDDGSSVEDGFSGWTDEEIIKARFSSKIALELERLSLSQSP